MSDSYWHLLVYRKWRVKPFGSPCRIAMPTCAQPWRIEFLCINSITKCESNTLNHIAYWTLPLHSPDGLGDARCTWVIVLSRCTWDIKIISWIHLYSLNTCKCQSVYRNIQYAYNKSFGLLVVAYKVRSYELQTFLQLHPNHPRYKSECFFQNVTRRKSRFGLLGSPWHAWAPPQADHKIPGPMVRSPTNKSIFRPSNK
jgi:hypothetical protein